MSKTFNRRPSSIAIPVQQEEEAPIRRQTTEEPLKVPSTALLSSPAVILTPLTGRWADFEKGTPAAKTESAPWSAGESKNHDLTEVAAEESPSMQLQELSSTSSSGQLNSISPRTHNPYQGGDGSTTSPSMTPRSSTVLSGSVPLPPSLARLNASAVGFAPKQHLQTVRFMPPPPMNPYTSEILKSQALRAYVPAPEETEAQQSAAAEGLVTQVGEFCFNTMMRWYDRILLVQDTFLLHPHYSPTSAEPLYIPEQLTPEEEAYLVTARCPPPSPDQYTFEDWIGLVSEWWRQYFSERQQRPKTLPAQYQPVARQFQGNRGHTSWTPEYEYCGQEYSYPQSSEGYNTAGTYNNNAPFQGHATTEYDPRYSRPQRAHMYQKKSSHRPW